MNSDEVGYKLTIIALCGFIVAIFYHMGGFVVANWNFITKVWPWRG
jgi:hypothetical protein